jgi:hypothetical protein
MSITDILATAAIVVTVLGILYQAFFNKSQDSRNVLDRLKEVETKVGLFWSMMEQHAAAILHHPITPDRDKLIDGYLAGTLSTDDAKLFAKDLNSLISDPSQASGERLAASFMLTAVIHKYKLDIQAI